MTESASEKAAAHLLGNGGEQSEGTRRGATGEYARLSELLLSDRKLTADEREEFQELAARHREGTLTGSPARVTRKRESVAGERPGDNEPTREPPITASDIAAAYLLGRNR